MANKPGNAYYDPSTGAAAVFAALFGITTAAHIFQWVRYKKVWIQFPRSSNNFLIKDALFGKKVVAVSLLTPRFK